MKSHTVEYLRFGDTPGILRLSDRYIRNLGVTGLGGEVSCELTQEQLAYSMALLDYARFTRDGDQARENAERILARLSPYVERFLLREDLEAGAELVQVDVVTAALELAQLPFEIVEETRPSLVVTRRIRQAWPPPAVVRSDTPRVVFAWAEPPRMPVPHARHRELLAAALGKGGTLVEVPHATRETLRDALTAQTRPTHVHLLMHGMGPAPHVDPFVPAPPALLALEDGQGRTDRCSPEDLVALLGSGPRPQVVTLATCHSAEVDPLRAGATAAHSLHAAGVPVVLASQLALTQAGSDCLVSVFLDEVFAGHDPRAALRHCRDRLRSQTATTYYDRIALVGYVHVDPDIDQRLKARRFTVALASLKASSVDAKAQVDRLLEVTPAMRDLTPEEAAAAEAIGTAFRTVRDGLAQLEHDAPLTTGEREELYGLQGSALKREAEAAWSLARCLDPAGAAHWTARSRAALGEATEAYGRAARLSRDHHWTWVQWLVLVAVQDPQGARTHADDWVAAKVAARDAASLPSPPDGAANRGAVLDRIVWGWGSLAELYLLAPLFGQPPAMEEARACLDALVAVARTLRRDDPIEATRNQLTRYQTWWGADPTLPLPRALIESAIELRDYLTRAATAPPEHS